MNTTKKKNTKKKTINLQSFKKIIFYLISSLNFKGKYFIKKNDKFQNNFSKFY